MASSTSIDADAKLIYNYHRLHHQLEPASAIFCLCSLDTRVAVRAADLYLAGLAPLLIFSGGVGILTEGRFDGVPEAEAFAAIARDMGVPNSAIVVEPRSTNTGENVRFTYALLEEKGLLGNIKSFILVQKPYMERRTYATFVKQWPGEGVKFRVTSPEVEWEEYPDEENPRELVMSIMVGDLVRIREYPAKGYQIVQEIPENVWEAGQRMIIEGYSKHLP
ncbi:hypothetical protein GYMLUDRAFT_161712 [Collybiopsis luxurians FD-317 M1]|uniref:DUF218 domain-containing protein n=1 Tax=Collybiopsis luxurians FD-317 M1 TaxID=944289 RepID=A0A0D0CVZ5_9AGAR|nr:hypothetical protein GYMLUDRAFT_161712 [Collybiopsis luxurians FD-317 M1]